MRGEQRELPIVVDFFFFRARFSLRSRERTSRGEIDRSTRQNNIICI